MSQASAMQSLDAELFAAMRDAGFADAGTYTAPGGSAIACTVMVDHAFAGFGDDAAEVAGDRVLVTLQLAEVAEPERGAIVVADGATWTLDREDSRDQSISRWVVLP